MAHFWVGRPACSLVPDSCRPLRLYIFPYFAPLASTRSTCKCPCLLDSSHGLLRLLCRVVIVRQRSPALVRVSPASILTSNSSQPSPDDAPADMFSISRVAGSLRSPSETDMYGYVYCNTPYGPVPTIFFAGAIVRNSA